MCFALVVSHVDVHGIKVSCGVESSLKFAHPRAEHCSYRVALAHHLAAFGVEVGVDGRSVTLGLSCKRTQSLAASVLHCLEEVVLFHFLYAFLLFRTEPSSR